MNKKSRIIGLISIVPGTVCILYLTAALGLVVLSEGEPDFGPNPYQTAFLLFVPCLALVQLWRLLYRETPLSEISTLEKTISTVVGIPAVLLGVGITFLMLFTAPAAIVFYGVFVLPLTIYGGWCLYDLWLA
ncbi:hypothetical protein MO867_21880 [Microbulbifer sp. OS29]|uniref:Uncharacterized protein n=1 Tax=Microbulbifer okhotskensis TaxID=2926617 RepID=A0A9X2EXD7_9GAMM|nr:hypothetical protein [Microbulbifer okhotskensis]MCO1336978.1 hypothetical protein [Microbulbifer okhotskensis]